MILRLVPRTVRLINGGTDSVVLNETYPSTIVLQLICI